MMKLIAKTLGWGLAGAVITPVLVFCAALLSSFWIRAAPARAIPAAAI